MSVRAAPPSGPALPRHSTPLAPHHLEHMPAASQPFCEAERRTALGDARTDLCRATGSWTCQAEDGLTRSRRRVHDLIDTFIERLLNR